LSCCPLPTPYPSWAASEEELSKLLQERAEFLLCVSPAGAPGHVRGKAKGAAGPTLGQTVADGGDEAVVRALSLLACR
jgi:hypothetical protein